MTSSDSTRTTKAGPLARSVFVCLAVGGAGLAGCGSGSGGRASGAGQVVAGYATVDNAPWRDYDAAISSALMGSELAVVERLIESPTRRRWVLLSAQDEPAELLVTVPELWAEPWDSRVVYECSIGHFGAPEREKAFVDAVRAWRPKYSR